MPETRKPVTPRPGCCERGGCDRRAEFIVTSETNAGVETARACSAHLVEMLPPVVVLTLERILGE